MFTCFLLAATIRRFTTWHGRHVENTSLQPVLIIQLEYGVLVHASIVGYREKKGDNQAKRRMNTGSTIHVFTDHTHYVQGVAWDPLGEYVATQSSDR